MTSPIDGAGSADEDVAVATDEALFTTLGDDSADEASVDDVETPVDPEVQRLQAELEASRAETAEFRQRLVDASTAYTQLQTDFTNLKARTRRQLEQADEDVRARIAGQILPIIDNFERALSVDHPTVETLLQGLGLTLSEMYSLLRNALGATEIEAQGCEFDPEVHFAVQNETQSEDTEPSDRVKVNTVSTVHLRGYKLSDKVIRPASVTVLQPVAEPVESGHPLGM